MAVRSLNAISKMQWKYWCKTRVCTMEHRNISPATRKPHQVGAVGFDINLIRMLQGEERIMSARRGIPSLLHLLPPSPSALSLHSGQPLKPPRQVLLGLHTPSHTTPMSRLSPVLPQDRDPPIFFPSVLPSFPTCRGPTVPPFHCSLSAYLAVFLAFGPHGRKQCHMSID